MSHASTLVLLIGDPGYARLGGATIPYNSESIYVRLTSFPLVEPAHISVCSQIDIFEILVENLAPRWVSRILQGPILSPTFLVFVA